MLRKVRAYIFMTFLNTDIAKIRFLEFKYLLQE